MATRLQENKCRHLQVFKGLNPELLAKYHLGQNLLVEASRKYKRRVNRFYLLKERHTNKDRRNCWQPNLKVSFCTSQRNFPHDSILWPTFFPSQVVVCRGPFFGSRSLGPFPLLMDMVLHPVLTDYSTSPETNLLLSIDYFREKLFI